MKINRLIALTAIALLVVGAMGVISMKALAQPAAQTQTCDQQDGDSAEIQDAPDTDNVDLQCGDQNEGGEEAEASDGQETASIGTPAITAQAAQKIAEAYLNAGTAVNVELDDEDGALVYSVEFTNGTDVKVDAMTGDVLGTEPAED